MIRYYEFKPTQFDPSGLGLEDRQDWFVSSVAHNRDSAVLAESNWETALKTFESVDPEGNDHEIHRFGHWANGWFEIILLRPDSEAAQEAEDIESALADYPILDESDYSDRENEAIQEYWKNCSLKERVDICGECDVIIFAARREDEVPDECMDYLRERILL